MNKLFKGILISGLVLHVTVLVACGGSSSGASNTPATGEISMNITDAPVDFADSVDIVVTGMTLKPSSGEELFIQLDGPDINEEGELEVNLLDLSDGSAMALFSSVIVPAGDYQWARFQIDSDRAFIVIDGMQYNLQMPADKFELKTSGNFNVPADGTVSYTVDWDLRKSIVEMGNSGTNFKLKPVLHLREDATSIVIKGAVDSTLLSAECTEVSDVGGVYVYLGHGIIPGDLGSANRDQPLYTQEIDTSDNSFVVGPLPGNENENTEFTLAFTCDAGSDNPDENDDAVLFADGSSLELTLQPGVAEGLLIATSTP